MQWLVNPDEEILDWKAVCGKTARTVWREGRLIAFPTPIIVGAFPIPSGITSFGCPHILVYSDESWSLGTRITLTVFAFLRVLRVFVVNALCFFVS